MTLEKEIKQEGFLLQKTNGVKIKLDELNNEIKSQYSKVDELITNASITELNNLIKQNKLTYHTSLDGMKVVYYTIELKEVGIGIKEEVHVAYLAKIQRGVNHEKQATVGIFGEIIDGKEERLRNSEGEYLGTEMWKYQKVQLENLRILAKDNEWKVE